MGTSMTRNFISFIAIIIFIIIILIVQGKLEGGRHFKAI